MTKVPMALAALLVLGSATSGGAFAATNSSQSAFERGQAINACRAKEDAGMNNHHARLAVDACVQRLLARVQSTTDRLG